MKSAAACVFLVAAGLVPASQAEIGAHKAPKCKPLQGQEKYWEKCLQDDCDTKHADVCQLKAPRSTAAAQLPHQIAEPDHEIQKFLEQTKERERMMHASRGAAEMRGMPAVGPKTPAPSGPKTLPSQQGPKTVPPPAGGHKTLPPQQAGPKTLPPVSAGPKTLPPQQAGPKTLPPQGGHKTLPPHTEDATTTTTTSIDVVGDCRVKEEYANTTNAVFCTNDRCHLYPEFCEGAHPVSKCKPIAGQEGYWQYCMDPNCLELYPMFCELDDGSKAAARPVAEPDHEIKKYMEEKARAMHAARGAAQMRGAAKKEAHNDAVFSGPGFVDGKKEHHASHSGEMSRRGA